MLKQVLFACGLLAGLSAVAAASPMISLDDPCSSANEVAVNTTNPISLDVTAGGGQFCFYNALTGSDNPIGELQLQATTVLDAAQQAQVSSIVCQSQFFSPEQCTATYDQNTDSLAIKFYNPNPDPDHDAGPSNTDPEINENEGIPQVLSGCSNDPSAVVNNPQGPGSLPCSTKGYFVISLDGGTSNPNNTGDWDTLNVNSFDVTQINGVAISTPEPSAWLVLSAGLILLGGFARRRALQRP